MVARSDRFDSKVDRSGPHHLWLGARSAQGVGQVRVDGKLMTAPRAAWARAYGDPPSGSKVLACPDEPACVRPEHLRLDRSATAITTRRARRGSGSIAERADGSWRITASAGYDDSGSRRRSVRTIRGTKQDATKALAQLIAETGDGSQLPSRTERDTTVDELVAWYLDFARTERGLEHSTLVGYADAYKTWIKPAIGSKRANSIRSADLDKVFGRLRRAGLSRSRMNNARAMLSGAYKWGKRHRKVASNPVDGFELPTTTHRPRTPKTPELDDLLRLLDGADRLDPELAPVLKLGATTGMRRGELAGLRRDRLHLEDRELVVDNAVNDAGGVVVEKPTKTQRSRVVSIDDATVNRLSDHLRAMDERATLCGTSIPPDAFVFSLDVTCTVPMRPELMTRRMRALRSQLGIEPGEFDATILALRKWTSTELMDAGFNPSAVSDRQGHTVQVMLHHYSSRRRSADRSAADHLGRQVYGNVGADKV